MQNKDIEQYALAENPTDEAVSERVELENLLEQEQEEQESARAVDKYKMVAVVDAGRSFANNEVRKQNLF